MEEFKLAKQRELIVKTEKISFRLKVYFWNHKKIISPFEW